jgi:hypothetical protein
MDNEGQWPPKCCINAIPFRTITKHTHGELLKRYKEKAEEFKTPMDQRVYCSEPDCGAWIRKEQVNRAAKTARCRNGHSICTICRQAAHGTGNACPRDRDRQMADALAQEEGWMRCFRCSVLVEHREACQHMTCICGAQFCYVCGAMWRTCSCTSEQLAEIKERARQRRSIREAEEAAEERELREALEQIERLEAEEAARAEERRRRKEEKYEALRVKLTDLGALQRMVLTYEHDRQRDEALRAAAAARTELAEKQDVDRVSLRAAVAATIADREMDWDRDYRCRVAWEKHLEEEYAHVLELFWADKAGGGPRIQAAMREYMKKNDHRMDIWRRWKDNELERFRFEQEDDLAIREELMVSAKDRLEDNIEADQADLQKKHKAQFKWVDLVLAERMRLLAEVEALDLDHGVDTPDQSDDDAPPATAPEKEIPQNVTMEQEAPEDVIMENSNDGAQDEDGAVLSEEDRGLYVRLLRLHDRL